MDKQQVKGRVNEAVGKVKEKAGDVTGNRNLQDKGTMQKDLGRVQSRYGDLKNEIKKGLHERKQ